MQNSGLFPSKQIDKIICKKLDEKLKNKINKTKCKNQIENSQSMTTINRKQNLSILKHSDSMSSEKNYKISFNDNSNEINVELNISNSQDK